MKNNKLIFIVLIALIFFINFSSAQLAQGQTKWLGNIVSNVMPSDFFSYWNQMTLQWLGKWNQT
jgi:cell division protein FtsW (lipid II flippase)